MHRGEIVTVVLARGHVLLTTKRLTRTGIRFAGDRVLACVALPHYLWFHRAAYSRKNSASAITVLLNSSSSTRSFGAWMLLKPSVAPSNRISASGTAVCNAWTSGIDPPVATFTVLSPHAVESASRAASYAGPDVPAAKPSPVAPDVMVSETPNGRTFLRCLTSAACASFASCCGCTRRLILARA